MASRIRRGLYAITDDTLTEPSHLLHRVEQAVLGGAVMVQFRSKILDLVLREWQAAALAVLCHRHDVPLIINDDVLLAAKIGADGVHLGKDDMALSEARAMLGANAIIGISCYNEFARAQQAKVAGADYIAFGRFFSSSTKPLAAAAQPALITKARSLQLPVVAIGGITVDNARPLIEAGADLLAVVQGLFGQDDVFHTAQQFTTQIRNAAATAIG